MDYAIIVAGGSGQRMQHTTPKQFLLLAGKPIICHAIEIFSQTFPNIQIIVVLPLSYLQDTAIITNSLSASSIQIQFVEGGPTRFDSVKNGLNYIPFTEKGIVFIHDAVRPLINSELLLRCYKTAIEHVNAIPCIELNDSLREVDGDLNKHVNRANFRSIQTPQTFQLAAIKKAFEIDYQEQFTDDASVLELTGIKINLVQGLEENLKITKPLDLHLAEIILKERKLIE